MLLEARAIRRHLQKGFYCSEDYWLLSEFVASQDAALALPRPTFCLRPIWQRAPNSTGRVARISWILPARAPYSELIVFPVSCCLTSDPFVPRLPSFLRFVVERNVSSFLLLQRTRTITTRFIEAYLSRNFSSLAGRGRRDSCARSPRAKGDRRKRGGEQQERRRIDLSSAGRKFLFRRAFVPDVSRARLLD